MTHQFIYLNLTAFLQQEMFRTQVRLECLISKKQSCAKALMALPQCSACTN